MKNEIEIVAKWFSGERALSNMTVYTANGLKEWEKHVIETFFPFNAKILNIACGMGREAFALYDMGYKVSAIDITEEVIKKAKNEAADTCRHIDFTLTNGLDIPFADSQFDIVIMWAQAFGNIYGRDNQIHFLNECNRVLKKGGLLSYSGHDSFYVKQVLHEQYIDGKKAYLYADTECYWELFTIDELAFLAQTAGFEVLTCENTLKYNPSNLDSQVLQCVAKKQ